MYVKYNKTRIDNSDLEDVKEETKEKKDKEHWKGRLGYCISYLQR